MKVIEPFRDGSSQSHSRHCEFVDPGAGKCAQTTREGKPFCPDHVEQNDYVSKVLREIEIRKAEDELVKQGDTPVSGYNIKGITVREILQHLAEHGTRTKERLCRELRLDKKVLDGYAEALVRRGLVTLGRTNRGSETLTLRRPTSSRRRARAE